MAQQQQKKWTVKKQSMTTPNGVILDGSYWDEVEFIGEFTREDYQGNPLNVTICRVRRGALWLVRIQEWYKGKGDDGRWMPGKGGMSMPLDMGSDILPIITQAFGD